MVMATEHMRPTPPDPDGVPVGIVDFVEGLSGLGYTAVLIGDLYDNPAEDGDPYLCAVVSSDSPPDGLPGTVVIMEMPAFISGQGRSMCFMRGETEEMGQKIAKAVCAQLGIKAGGVVQNGSEGTPKAMDLSPEESSDSPKDSS